MTENNSNSPAKKVEEFNEVMTVAIELFLLKVELAKRTIDLRLATDGRKCKQQKIIRKQIGYALLEGDYGNVHKIFNRYERAGIESQVFFQSLMDVCADFESMGKKLAVTADIDTRNLQLAVIDEEFKTKIQLSSPGVTVCYEPAEPACQNHKVNQVPLCAYQHAFDENVEIRIAS